MRYEKGDIKVRPLKEEDAEFLYNWLNDPRILEYYEGRDKPFTHEMVKEAFYNDDKEKVACIVQYKGEKVGYLQYYPLDDETKQRYGYTNLDEFIYGTDQFIGDSRYWNKGVGTLMIKAMVEYFMLEKGLHRLVMDPMTWNRRAIRCYEKCGYSKARILPQNELHEGEWHDCWLMEYIPD
ncbi:GNAT family N-acetyltransferase [Rossellomorea marisflavi]|nr:GNAT family N-acetyltransferase [Rossellomorea marisflavi]KMK96946.1 2-aminoglycoside phosphotransferase [Rossellomorea marisflavi]KML06010.1 2-aminoglycoside phosphotransferase [Rossellomorea marisflavi]KML33066.1 2-aminoglycoside phosphotransferase [Rossellomorea marisflavi]QHA35716.1 GNAT family N-acetyltransferase [Rossellomorea marisflavi]TYO71870.1 GNAT family N-acetyltransferase [Rossellomorea marisflavi]